MFKFLKCPKCDYTTRLELQMKVKGKTKALSLHLIEEINDTYQVDVNLRFYETSSRDDERL